MAGAGTSACESCGRTDEDLFHVRRLYVTPESWDTPGAVDEGDEEQWCLVCRTHYPHILIVDEPPSPSETV